MLSKQKLWRISKVNLSFKTSDFFDLVTTQDLFCPFNWQKCKNK